MLLLQFFGFVFNFFYSCYTPFVVVYTFLYVNYFKFKTETYCIWIYYIHLRNPIVVHLYSVRYLITIPPRLFNHSIISFCNSCCACASKSTFATFSIAKFIDFFKGNIKIGHYDNLCNSFIWSNFLRTISIIM